MKMLYEIKIIFSIFCQECYHEKKNTFFFNEMIDVEKAKSCKIINFTVDLTISHDDFIFDEWI